MASSYLTIRALILQYSESTNRYEELVPSNNSIIDEIAGTLQFNPVAEDDKGSYKCGATNDEGKSFDWSSAIYFKNKMAHNTLLNY